MVQAACKCPKSSLHPPMFALLFKIGKTLNGGR